MIEIFVSHSSDDKNELLPLKKELKEYDVTLFLAHENISSGEDYIDAIRNKLHNCHAFLIYSTKNSKKSDFCNQEIGWALALNKPFIILGRQDTREFDWGLMPRIQSCGKLNFENTTSIADNILRILTTNGLTSPVIEYIKNLKTYKYRNFELHDDTNISPTLEEDKINLVSNKGWNDNGYFTEFALYYGSKYIGRIKLCKKDQITWRHTFDYFDSKTSFKILPNNFISYITYSSDHNNDLNRIVSYLLRDCKVYSSLEKGLKEVKLLKIHYSETMKMTIIVLFFNIFL